MGKNIIYTYSCDKCNANFKSPDDVLSIDGVIVNGEGEPRFADILKSTDVLCKKCFVSIIKEQVVCGVIDTPVIVEEEKVESKEVSNIEYITLRKIENKDDEDAFIGYLGHISRENFTKIYSKSLIGYYYPVEDSCTYTFNSIDSLCNVSLIYKAFAGIPQIKVVSAYVTEPSIAYANKSVLIDE